MSKSYSNKPLVILKTAFIVSFLFAITLGIIFSVFQGRSWIQFLYLTYLFFVNNLLMPVSIVAIMCYYIHRKQKKNTGIILNLKLIGVLSCASFILLFIWNMMDFLFHYHIKNHLTSDAIMLDLQEELLLGAIISIPLSILVSITYRLVDSK
jgi:hypothetical protein